MAMFEHHWYLLTFRSEPDHFYFYSTGTMLKNRRMQGWQIHIDPTHPRRQPRVKVVSVDPSRDVAWRPVAADAVPVHVREAIASRVAVTRLGNRTRWA